MGKLVSAMVSASYAAVGPFTGACDDSWLASPTTAPAGAASAVAAPAIRRARRYRAARTRPVSGRSGCEGGGRWGMCAGLPWLLVVRASRGAMHHSGVLRMLCIDGRTTDVERTLAILAI